jgi:multidrug resistance efflux pump
VATPVLAPVSKGPPSLALGHYEALAHLQKRAFDSATVPELCFVIANETYQLMPYRQAFVWACDASGAARLRTISGLATLGEDSPFTIWLKKLGAWLPTKVGADGEYLQQQDVPKNAQVGWAEWLPEFLLVFAIRDTSGMVCGYVGYAFEDAPSEALSALTSNLLDSYGHAWGRLAPSAKGKRWAYIAAKVALASLALLAVLALFVPVRMSVLAPAEIIGLDALGVSAPVDGVIKQFAVQPNQLVKENDLLFQLDETTIRNRREVALKAVAVARADAMAAQQKSFESDASKSELATLNGRVAERQAEVVYLEDQLKRLDVRAPRAGIVVFGDVNDWQGKPVVTGERVALLADPNNPGVLVYLPVADAINLGQGATVRLYLQVAPLTPLAAQISQTSYQSVLSPEGVASYRLRAKFVDLDPEQTALARIGLKGTAKIYGDNATLGYYLFRRPLSALRELTGW